MKRCLLTILVVLTLSACSTMQPPRYAISVDNIQALKQYHGARVAVALDQERDFSVSCRLMGPIEPADGLSFSRFISKAFNDELKMAGLHSTEGVQLSGEVTEVNVSSVSGLTNGYWILGIRIDSSNGESLSVSNKYSFKSGFDAVTACNATADALSPAVQDLIKATVTHPEFAKLLSS